MKKIILNHKSYLLYDDILKFKSELNKLKQNKFEIILFPSIQYLSLFKDEKKYLVGSQNFYSHKCGSFSGEVSLDALKSLGVNYTMISGYERMKIINEKQEVSKEKLFLSLSNKFNTLLYISPINNNCTSFNSIKREINKYLKGIDKYYLNYLSLVFETYNYDMDISKISKIVKRIKIYIKNKYNKNIEVYYAASNENNINSIIKVCDGVVLGKQSTNIENLKKLIERIE